MSRYIHPKYTDGKKILDLFEEYKKEKDDLNLPYEFSGVLTKLGIIQETWDDYKACNLNVEGNQMRTGKSQFSMPQSGFGELACGVFAL